MKRFFVLLLAVTLLLSGCACIPGSKLPANTDRYFLYAANDQVYCLDSKTGKTDEIRTILPVTRVVNAIVGDNSREMVFYGSLGDGEDAALFYWDGKSASAKLEVRNADLCRINKKMDFFIYLKKEDETYDLYQYDAQEGKQLIAKNVGRVSMTEDGKSILYIQAIPEEEQYVLFRKKRNGNPKRIADLGKSFELSATADHKVVCYTKGESENVLGGLCSAYMWTPSGGEKALPFKATGIKVFGKNEIYYTVSESDTFNNYYYDGKASVLLSANGSSAHGHKISDNLYTYSARVGEKRTTFLVSKGKQISAEGFFCTLTSQFAGLSVDGKTLYTFDGEYMYRTTVGFGGEMTTEKHLTTDVISPRTTSFNGDRLVKCKEGQLYLDGRLIATNVDDWRQSQSGQVLAYRIGEDLYRYDAEESVFLGTAGKNYHPAVSSKVVQVTEDGILQLIDKKGAKQIAVGCEAVQPAITWGDRYLGNIIGDGMTTGMWYTQMGTDMIVY